MREWPRLEASIRPDTIPAEGRDVAVVATAEQREALARDLGVIEIDRLEARLRATPFRGGIRAQGRLQATVVQACVVTLVPVSQDIDEPIDRIFLPGAEVAYAGPADAEVFVDLEGDDLPDRFDGNEADLSEMLIEVLSLAIDPYPRAPGAELEITGDASDPQDHPFAALRRLKDGE